jgi:antitoxin component YwqK of YwqJK toxin-antitoxin module
MRKVTTLILLSGAIALSGCASSNRANKDCCYVVDEKYVHKYGLEVAQNDWKARGKNGQVISTLDNGVVMTKQYDFGVLEGETTYTFPNSNTIEKVETYKNGQLVKTVINDESGAPKEETEMTAEGNKYVTIWYNDGTPQSRESYQDDLLVQAEYFNGSNKVESRVDNGFGTRIVRDQYGDLVSTDTFKNGALVSKTTYHKNGAPKAFTPYANNVVEGMRKTFMPAGEPETVEEWVGGVREGTTLAYKNGEKFAEVPYKNGRKNGIEKRYRDGSTLIEEISWRDNQRHGPSDTYVNGKVTKTEWYYNGQKVTKSAWDMKSNKKIN